MLFQRMFGKATEIAGNIFIANTRFLSRRKWIATPSYNTEILGEGQYRYRVNRDWCQAEPSSLPVNNCHEMVIDAKQRLYLLTDDPRNNVIILDTQGQVLNHWTFESSGAHGLTISQESDGEVLWICDAYNPRVMKFSLTGELLQTLPNPAALGVYSSTMPYSPTQTAVAPNGDVYVADGYGSQYVLQFNSKGEFIRRFGGKGQGGGLLEYAHGIAVDTRQPDNPVLLVTSRKASCIKRFTLAGDYIDDIKLPGGYPCRPVLHGKNMLIGLCWSEKHLKPNSGFVIMLDENNRVCATLGGTAEFDMSGNLTRLASDYSTFCHVHDVCADRAGNLYVCQWNAGKVYPFLLELIS
jgi:peptidylamidoglycolate lyase